MLIKSFSKIICHTGTSNLYGSILSSKNLVSICKIAFFLLISVFLWHTKTFAQNGYTTKNGYVLITGNYLDSVFFAESHKLIFNYIPTAKTIDGNISSQSFSSGIPQIDSLLSDKNHLISFNGYIPVDFLIWDHSEYNLDIPLEIKFDGNSINTMAKMKFSHLDKLSNYACIIESTFNVKLSDFNIKIPDQINNDISVQFIQTILRRTRK